jgi:hypothetical protein
MDKKTTIALGFLFAVLLPEHGFAQSEETRVKALWGGAVLGGGFFEHDGEGADLPLSSRESKPGFTVGGQLSYDLHPRIALNAEVLFTMKGFHDLALGERRGTYRLNYLELPLLARVSLPAIEDRFLPFLTAGPMVGILLSASGEEVPSGEPRDLDGVWRTIDFGIIFGAGATVRLSPHDLLGLEVRYDMGLRAIEYNRDTINNRGILLVLRYETCICSRSAAR